MINLLEVNGVVFRLATAPVALATEGEKLTEDERDVLTHGGAGPQTCAKALRIIDAQAAALDRLRALLAPHPQYGEVTGVGAGPLREALAGAPAPEATYEQHVESLEADSAAKKLTAANARIVGLERATAHVGNLQRALAAANARAEAAEEDKRCERDLRVQAESEAAALRAELDDAAKAYEGARLAYEAQLKDLRAELTEWTRGGASVGVACVGRMQQAKHMADAAVRAIGAVWDETSPQDIADAVAALRAEVGRLDAQLQGAERALACYLSRVPPRRRERAHLAAQPATAGGPAPDGSLLIPVQRWDSAQPAPLATPVDWAAAEPAVSAGEHARDARRDGAGSK